MTAFCLFSTIEFSSMDIVVAHLCHSFPGPSLFTWSALRCSIVSNMTSIISKSILKWNMQSMIVTLAVISVLSGVFPCLVPFAAWNGWMDGWMFCGA